MTIQRDKWSDFMILRIIFLGMLCIPFLYMFFILFGYLIDDIVIKDEKIPEDSDNYRKPSYSRSQYYEEPEEDGYRKDRVSKNKRKFRIIR